jgi:hypothetical protein
MVKRKQNMTGAHKENKPQTTATEVGGENMEQVIESSTTNRKKAMLKAGFGPLLLL